MIQLKKVDSGNIWEIIKLSVNHDQMDFVATNTRSILEAYITITSGLVALPFGIYNGDTPIGFVMFGFDTDGDAEEPDIAVGNYCIWRFMIDKTYQGQGLGKKALQAAIEYLKSKPCGWAKYCWLSYEPENTGAKKLYESMGFLENGEMCGEEIVAVLPLFD